MDMSHSIRRLTTLFIALFMALSAALVYWQVIVAGTIAANPHNSRVCLPQNTTKRGNIYDRNGVLLAYSKPDPKACGGYTRVYTDPSLAGVIGYYVPGFSSPYGSVESVYNDVLNGTDGQTALNNLVDKTIHASPVGDNIYLTIDDRIQRIAAQDFDNYHPETDPFYSSDPAFENEAFPTDRGSVVITDPKTGEVLAMVSSPGYDPNKMVQTLSSGTTHYLDYYNQLANNPENPMLDRVLQGKYDPGSTFKTVTLLGALDSGDTKLTTEWPKSLAYDKPTWDGTTVSGDNLGYDTNPQYVFHFPVDTEFGFANSDNIMFAHIGVDMGQQLWLSYTKKMYFDQTVPFDLPVAESSVLHANGDPLKTIDLADDAFGQGVDFVTPFQMSLVDNIAANNGVLMQPMLLTKITNASNQTLQSYSPKSLATVVSPTAAYQTREAMSAVTDCGSAWRLNAAFNDTYGIIGKTGTGQVSSDGTKAHAWMMTQAPYFNNPNQVPALTIVAMRENGGESTYSAGPAVWRIYNDIFSKGYVKTAQPTAIDPNSYCLANNLWQTP
jgi:penicillin-binding protein A